MNPHEKLAMEFFSPPGPSAREWESYVTEGGYSDWIDGAEHWPAWDKRTQYRIRLKSQTITLPERTLPKPLDVGELADGERYWTPDPQEVEWVWTSIYWRGLDLSERRAERGLFYPYTDQGKADAIAAAKGMINWRDEG